MENFIGFGTTIVSLSMVMGAMFKFMWGRIDKKFDLVFEDLKEIKKDIRSLDVRLSRLEGQDEQQFRNEIKLLVRNRGQD